MSIHFINLDLDGVFADFNKRVKELSGKEPHELDKRRMWAIVNSDKRFFANLDMMPGAASLFHAVQKLNIPFRFLTGAPSSHAFREQKKEWVEKQFGAGHEVIVLPRKEKQTYAHAHHILIDDTPDMIDQWIAKGGHGILHISPMSSVEQLVDYINACK